MARRNCRVPGQKHQCRHTHSLQQTTGVIRAEATVQAPPTCHADVIHGPVMLHLACRQPACGTGAGAQQHTQKERYTASLNGSCIHTGDCGQPHKPCLIHSCFTGRTNPVLLASGAAHSHLASLLRRVPSANSAATRLPSSGQRAYSTSCSKIPGSSGNETAREQARAAEGVLLVPRLSTPKQRSRVSSQALHPGTPAKAAPAWPTRRRACRRGPSPAAAGNPPAGCG